jgi:predicted dithiol-disulfide oxidoreductase (DUF899 family)
MGREGPTGASYFTGMVDDLALWRRALSPTEVRRLFEEGQAGQSLGDLLRQPTTLIQFVSVAKTPNALTIRFKNLGGWQSFRLLRASQWAGPFVAVSGLTPVSLGNDEYRFDYPLNSNAAEYFRVEGL